MLPAGLNSTVLSLGFSDVGLVAKTYDCVRSPPPPDFSSLPPPFEVDVDSISYLIILGGIGMCAVSLMVRLQFLWRYEVVLFSFPSLVFLMTVGGLELASSHSGSPWVMVSVLLSTASSFSCRGLVVNSNRLISYLTHCRLPNTETGQRC
jgi:hypothetical protein